MGVNPNQGQNPDPSSQYGGYTGYTPPQSASPKDDPYNAQWYGQPQPGTSQPGAQQQYDAGQQQQQYAPPDQQQQSYQPPLSATSSRQGSGGSVNSTVVFGLSARIAALLSYLFTWVGGIFFLLFERKNQFVRFAAAQSITTFGPLSVVYFLLELIANIPLLGPLLAPLVSCVTGILLLAGGLTWVFLMVQSYRGITVRIPIVSVYADALLARFSGSRRNPTI